MGSDSSSVGAALGLLHGVPGREDAGRHPPQGPAARMAVEQAPTGGQDGRPLVQREIAERPRRLGGEDRRRGPSGAGHVPQPLDGMHRRDANGTHVIASDGAALVPDLTPDPAQRANDGKCLPRAAAIDRHEAVVTCLEQYSKARLGSAGPAVPPARSTRFGSRRRRLHRRTGAGVVAPRQRRSARRAPRPKPPRSRRRSRHKAQQLAVLSEQYDQDQIHVQQLDQQVTQTQAQIAQTKAQVTLGARPACANWPSRTTPRAAPTTASSSCSHRAASAPRPSRSTSRWRAQASRGPSTA